MTPPTNASTTLTCDDVLDIARRDAEGAYRDGLADFHIRIALQPDGWHVDYNLTKPLVAGGGPHYVIDVTTGKITAKRYEQ